MSLELYALGRSIWQPCRRSRGGSLSPCGEDNLNHVVTESLLPPLEALTFPRHLLSEVQGGRLRRCVVLDLRASPLVSAPGPGPGSFPRIGPCEGGRGSVFRAVICVHAVSICFPFSLGTVRTQVVCVRVLAAFFTSWLMSCILLVRSGAHIGSIGPAVPLQAGSLILSLLTSLPSFVEHFFTSWFNPPSPSSIPPKSPSSTAVCLLMGPVSG